MLRVPQSHDIRKLLFGNNLKHREVAKIKTAQRDLSISFAWIHLCRILPHLPPIHIHMRYIIITYNLI